MIFKRILPFLTCLLLSTPVEAQIWNPGGGGGGGSVSVTASDPSVVINPTPGTGTFTVGNTAPINAQGTAASYTVLAGDMGKTITHTRSSAMAETLPQAGSAGFAAGVSYTEINNGSGTLTITPTTSTINGQSSIALTQYQSAYIISDGTNYVAFLGSSGGGSSVSVTAASPNIVINPTPGTGTFTVSTADLINAQGTAASYTIVTGDMGKTVTHSKATAVAITLPQAGSTGFATGASYSEINLGAGPVTITPTTSTINGATTLTLLQNQGAYIISDGTNWIAFEGMLPIAPPQTVTVSGAAIATNFRNGPVVYATLDHTGTTTISNPTNAVDGGFLLYALTQDGTGSNLVTWSSSSGGFDFGATGAPTLSTAAGKVDYVGFRYNGNLSKWAYQGQALGN